MEREPGYTVAVGRRPEGILLMAAGTGLGVAPRYIRMEEGEAGIPVSLYLIPPSLILPWFRLT